MIAANLSPNNGSNVGARRLQEVNIALVATTYSIQEIIKIPCVSFIDKDLTNQKDLRFFGALTVLEASLSRSTKCILRGSRPYVSVQTGFLGNDFWTSLFSSSAVQIYSV